MGSDSASVSRLLHFRDLRPPQEIQFDLERELMVLLPSLMQDSRLTYRRTAKVNGASCAVRLCFEAALPRTNCYSVQLVMTWDGQPADSHDYHRKASAGWLDLWTRHLTIANPPPPGEGSSSRYATLAAQARTAEAHFINAGAVQQEILTLLKAGASFSTAHKEGGTTISFQGGHFVRTDYGESNCREEFPDDAALLACLRNLYQWETGRSTYPEQPSDLDRWKLILRLLRPAVQGVRGGKQSGQSTLQCVLAFLIAIVAVGGLVLIRGGPFRFHRYADQPALKHSPTILPPPVIRLVR